MTEERSEKNYIESIRQSYTAALNEYSRLQGAYLENIQKLNELAFNVEKTWLETTNRIAQKAPEVYDIVAKQAELMTQLLWTPSKALRSI